MASYQPSPLFRGIASVLDFIRSEYSRDIARYLASSWWAEELNHAGITSNSISSNSSYPTGLIFLACLVGGFAVLWALVLIMMKCRGRNVFGCATGHAVVLRSHRDIIASHSDNNETNRPHHQPNDANTEKKRKRRRITVDIAPITKEMNAAAEVSLHPSAPSTDEDELDDDCSKTTKRDVDDISVESEESTMDTSPRETRIRIAFLFFTLLVLVCIPLVFAFTVAPISTAWTRMESEEELLEETLDQAQQLLFRISFTLNTTVEVVHSIPLNLSFVCPSNLVEFVPIDMNTMASQVSNFKEIEQWITGNISEVTRTLLDMKEGLDFFDATKEELVTYNWLVPVFLLLMGCTTVILMYGVVKAWKHGACMKHQRIQTYAVMPLFVALTMLLFALAIAAAVSTAAGSDACVYPGVNYNNATNTNESSTSPDHMIDTLLQLLPVVNQTDPLSNDVYQVAMTYIRGCEEGTTTTTALDMILDSFRIQLYETATRLGDDLALANAMGADALSDLCGSTDVLSLLNVTYNLVHLLTQLEADVHTTQMTLSCPTIRDMYVHVVHDSICTDMTHGVSAGLILFLIMSVSSLCIVSLRSALRHPIHKEKIMPETDVALNMIVDEHEEYLTYISKYKAEWQQPPQQDFSTGSSIILKNNHLSGIGFSQDTQSYSEEGILSSHCMSYDTSSSFSQYSSSDDATDTDGQQSRDSATARRNFSYSLSNLENHRGNHHHHKIGGSYLYPTWQQNSNDDDDYLLEEVPTTHHPYDYDAPRCKSSLSLVSSGEDYTNSTTMKEEENNDDNKS